MDNRSNILLVGNTTQGQNLGGGANVYKGKAGGNLLQFRTISSTSASIQIFQVGDKILISGSTSGGTGGTSGSGIGWSNLTYGSTVAGCGTIASGTSRCNTFFGVQASANTVISNIYGCQNVALGYRALWQNTSGCTSIAIGSTALQTNTVGSNNIAIGSPAMLRNTSGQYNIAIGCWALTKNYVGSDNVIIGDCAGCTTSGSSNVYIGRHAGANATGSSKLYIANCESCQLICGDFIGKTVCIDNCLYVNSITCPSDCRLKSNISSISITPVDVEYKQFNHCSTPNKLSVGIIAQELCLTHPNLVSTDDKGYLGINYGELHSLEIAHLKCRVNELEKIINNLLEK